MIGSMRTRVTDGQTDGWTDRRSWLHRTRRRHWRGQKVHLAHLKPRFANKSAFGSSNSGEVLNLGLRLKPRFKLKKVHLAHLEPRFKTLNLGSRE